MFDWDMGFYVKLECKHYNRETLVIEFLALEWLTCFPDIALAFLVSQSALKNYILHVHLNYIGLGLFNLIYFQLKSIVY